MYVWCILNYYCMYVCMVHIELLLYVCTCMYVLFIVQLYVCMYVCVVCTSLAIIRTLKLSDFGCVRCGTNSIVPTRRTRNRDHMVM